MIADQHIKDGSNDDFYNNKIITAQFYAEQILPRSLAYATSVKSGHEAIMSMPTDSF